MLPLHAATLTTARASANNCVLLCRRTVCAALQGEADALYADAEEWTRRSVLYTAGNGIFSSDANTNFGLVSDENTLVR